MNRAQRDVAKSKPVAIPGVIETIADGLSIALARPLLLLVPMLLDLFYWIGPKVSIDALVNPISRWVAENDSSNSADIVERLDKIAQSDISWLLAFFVPSLLSESSRADIYQWHARHAFSSGSWALDILLLIAMVLGSGLLLMVYAVPLSNAAVSRGRTTKQVVYAIAKGWVRFLALLLLIVGIGLLILGPLALGTAILLLLGLNATPLLTMFAMLFVMFGFIALWFSPDAIAVNEVGPLKAIKYSFIVIKNYFWQSSGLVAASLLITYGLAELWKVLAGSAPGLLIGVIANSYFSTGLAIASMSFFANRIQTIFPGSVNYDVGPRDQ